MDSTLRDYFTRIIDLSAPIYFETCEFDENSIADIIYFAEVNGLRKVVENGYTLCWNDLWNAVSTGKLDMVEYILKQGVCPNECDLDKIANADAYNTCIFFGAFDFDNGCIDKNMVKLLLDYGAKHERIIEELLGDELFEFVDDFELIINDWASWMIK